MSDAPRPLPPKKEVALALLEGPSLFVHLDPRKSGVQVPKWFAGQPQLVLQLGLNMQIPIPDLKVDEEGLSCTLSFQRSPFWCRLPWSAVYALVGEDGRGMVWPEDVPPEVALQMQKQAATPASPPGTAKQNGKKPRGKLSAVADPARPPKARDSRPTDLLAVKEAREAKRAAEEREAAAPPTFDAEGAPDPRGGSHVEERAPTKLGSVRPTSTAPSRRDGGAARVRPPEDEPSGARPPALRPVPVAARSAARESDATDDKDDKDAIAGPPSDRPGPDGGGKKPRRELPPYLRVIK